MDHVLSTERLVLRPVTADDHAALLAHWTQPDVRRFLFDGAALSAAEVAETIEESIGHFAARGFGIWLIELGSAVGLAAPRPAWPARPGCGRWRSPAWRSSTAWRPARGVTGTPPRPPGP